MDFESCGRELLKGKNASALQELARSEDGRKVAAMVDGNSLEKAAREGDRNALSEALQKILSTPEGRRLAEQVKKAVKGDG